MIKKMQIKIAILFVILGLVIIGSLSFIYIYQIQDFNNAVNQEISIEINNSEISNLINEKTNFLILISSVVAVLYITFSIFINITAIKKINVPISDYMKKFENDTVEKKNNYLIEKKETNEFVNAIQLVTTELHEDLNNVREQKKQIETILVHLTDGIVAFNLEGKITYINPAAKKLLELAEDDDNFDKIFNKIEIDVNLEKLIYLEEWTSSEQKVSIGNKYVTIVFKPFKDRNEINAGVITLIQDITEHVKLDNMRKEFVADVSHELKTPITSIMGYADTLLEGDYDKNTQERFLNVIATEARRMAKLVTDLLTLSRHDNDTVKTDKTEFDLGELVKRCQEKLQIEIKKKNHNVECFVTANVPLVVADKYGIERVILNILSNSIKYTADNGNIKIYVGFVYNDAYIKVIDNGIGIPAEDLSRIFERFYRVDKARTREMGGTGLGLSIAKEILDQNNGSIDIKSESGKGTEVVVRIPTNR